MCYRPRIEYSDETAQFARVNTKGDIAILRDRSYGFTFFFFFLRVFPIEIAVTCCYAYPSVYNTIGQLYRYIYTGYPRRPDYTFTNVVISSDEILEFSKFQITSWTTDYKITFNTFYFFKYDPPPHRKKIILNYAKFENIINLNLNLCIFL